MFHKRSFQCRGGKAVLHEHVNRSLRVEVDLGEDCAAYSDLCPGLERGLEVGAIVQAHTKLEVTSVVPIIAGNAETYQDSSDDLNITLHLVYLSQSWQAFMGADDG